MRRPPDARAFVATRRVLTCASLFSFLPLFVARTALAEVREVAERVAEQWRAAGAKVERGETRFLYENETMTVVVPVPHPDRGCTTVALIAARGMSFHAKVAGTDDDPLLDDSAARAASVAGVLQMERCAGIGPMDHLVVTSDAGRGAVETVVARSVKPLPAMRAVLPERTGGALPSPPDTGPVPPLPTASRRADQAEARVRRDGAKIAPREAWTAGADGTGEARVALEAGCHRVEIFAPEAHAPRGGRRLRLDVDAELRDDDDEMLARDRTEASDARLEACVGDGTAASVVFAGAPPGASIAAMHAWWALPEHLPSLWGPEARARMAAALRARHAANPREDAIALYQGAAGTTPIALPVEPGGCYIAAAAITHGHARGLGLRVIVAGRDAIDERGAEDDGGAVAFCARDASRAQIEVEARGTSVAWGVAVFRVQSAVWEAPR
jgi:hypothetical protein